MKKLKKPDYLYFSFSIKEAIITILILTAAFVLSLLISNTPNANISATLIFVLAVVFVSRFTNGCFFGLISSVAAMFAVNFAFTYPYFVLNFAISGYPLTFLVMLTVSLVISMLTAQTKKQAFTERERDKEKIRANLLRSVSHDIRTPLTSITGSASAYLENHKKLSEESKLALITDVRNEAQWLIRMVENILSITRIGDNSAYIQKNPEVAEEIVGEAVRKFKKIYDKTDVSIIIPEEIIFIPMDAILIEQVIINLMENSVIHGERTDLIRLELSCDNENAIFTVDDNGIGFQSDIKECLNGKVFKQIQIKGSDEKRCMGIGLSVCMSIINAHGGTMKAENKVNGSGAIFSFTLPLNS